MYRRASPPITSMNSVIRIVAVQPYRQRAMTDRAMQGLMPLPSTCHTRNCGDPERCLFGFPMPRGRIPTANWFFAEPRQRHRDAGVASGGIGVAGHISCIPCHPPAFRQTSGQPCHDFDRLSSCTAALNPPPRARRAQLSADPRHCHRRRLHRRPGILAPHEEGRQALPDLVWPARGCGAKRIEIAVAHWFGVSETTVWKWRQALGVEAYPPATKALQCVCQCPRCEWGT